MSSETNDAKDAGMVDNLVLKVYKFLNDDFRAIPDGYIAFCLFIITGIIMFIIVGLVLPNYGLIFLGLIGIFGMSLVIYAIYVGTSDQKTAMNSSTLFAVCTSVFFMFGLFTLALLYISSQDYSSLYPNLPGAIFAFLAGTGLFGILSYLFHVRDVALLANLDTTVKDIVKDATASPTASPSKGKGKGKGKGKKQKGGDSEIYKFATWL